VLDLDVLRSQVCMRSNEYQYHFCQSLRRGAAVSVYLDRYAVYYDEDRDMPNDKGKKHV